MADFEVDGHQYRSGRLDAFKQLLLVRKLGPLIARLALAQQQALPPAPNLPETGDAPVDPPPRPQVDFFKIAQPLLEGMSEMAEEDINAVTHTCLAVVQRHQGNSAWAAVWHVTARRLMFDDIDAMAMITICFNVITDNLQNFTRALSSISSPQPQPGSGRQENLSLFPGVKTG